MVLGLLNPSRGRSLQKSAKAVLVSRRDRDPQAARRSTRRRSRARWKCSASARRGRPSTARGRAEASLRRRGGRAVAARDDRAARSSARRFPGAARAGLRDAAAAGVRARRRGRVRRGAGHRARAAPVVCALRREGVRASVGRRAPAPPLRLHVPRTARRRGGVEISISARRGPFELILAPLECGRRPCSNVVKASTNARDSRTASQAPTNSTTSRRPRASRAATTSSSTTAPTSATCASGRPSCPRARTDDVSPSLDAGVGKCHRRRRGVVDDPRRDRSARLVSAD